MIRYLLGLLALELLRDSQGRDSEGHEASLYQCEATGGRCLLQLRQDQAKVAWKVVGADAGAKEAKVIVDANVGFFDFTLDHYRAFESLLWQYPSSSFVLLKIAPAVTSEGYQYRDSLPSNLFQKYQRMGYRVSTRNINGHSAGPAPGSPGAEWWGRYGVKLATVTPPEAYYMETGTSPEVSDTTGRLFVRLWQAFDSAAAGLPVVLSDLTLLLADRPPVPYVQFEASSGDAGLSLLVVDHEKALSCALQSFDAAANQGIRHPDTKSVRDCFAELLASGTPLSVSAAAENAADGELGLRIKRAVRDAAPSEYFVKAWQASASSDLGRSRNLFTFGGIATRKICPALVIPGYMKAGSTSFYKMLIQHPLFLSQHKGAHGFSEGNLFWLDDAGRRAAWSPMIEQDEPFEWFDVSVFYSEINESQVLEHIQNDCQRVPPILWLLREPVSMMMSAFRFMNGAIGSEHYSEFQEYCQKEMKMHPASSVAPTAFEVGLKFESTLHSFQKGEALSEYFGRYFQMSRMDKLLHDPLRWKEKLHGVPVLFTSLEEWTTNHAIFDQIYKLIGLEPFPVQTKHSLMSGSSVKVCRSCFDALENHFAPLKRALIDAIGRDINGWFPAALPHHVILQETC